MTWRGIVQLTRPAGIVALLVWALAGCATAAFDPATLSWAYTVNAAGLGRVVSLFPNDRHCRDAIAIDMAAFNNPGACISRPSPCQRHTVRGSEVLVASPDGLSYWSFAIVGGGSTWQAVAVADQGRCVAFRDAWKQAAGLAKTRCLPIVRERVR